MKEFDKYKMYEIEDGKISGINEGAFKNRWASYRLFKELFNERYGSIVEDGDLIEIHSGGWSDNEVLINELKDTTFWFLYHKATMIGGHYYFETGGLHSEQKWEVVKKDKVQEK